MASIHDQQVATAAPVRDSVAKRPTAAERPCVLRRGCAYQCEAACWVAVRES